MNITVRFKHIRHHLLKTVAVATLVIACGMHSEPARAGLPVFDYSAFANAIKDFFAQAERWTATTEQFGKVLDHYGKQVAFWEQQLNKLRSLNLQLFQLEQDFQPVDADYGIDVMCPGAQPSSIVDSVTSALTSAINADGDVIGEQQKLCIKIVRTKNRKYNDTVAYLASLHTSTDSFIDLTTMRLTEIGNSPGNTEGLGVETERYAANLELSRNKWQTAMEQYDIQLGLLTEQQTVLSKRAMSGKPSIWGTLVNTAALQAALTINK